MVSTDYTKPSQVGSNFQKSIATTDVLLLETGDKLLLENGTDAILLDILGRFSTDYTKSTINSTSYSKP